MIDLTSTEHQSIDGEPFGWTVTIDEFGGPCPVQGNGTVCRLLLCWYWYFRARGDSWTLEVGERLDDFGLVPEGEEQFIARGTYGPWPDAGYMEDAEAARYLEEALVAFSRGARGAWEHPDPRGRRLTLEETVALLTTPVGAPPDDDNATRTEEP